MSSTPGHHQVFECIGRVLMRHVRKGVIDGVLLEVKVDDEGPLRIGVVAEHPWPDVAPGDLVFAKGRLRLEPMALGRRNTHFLHVVHRDHLAVVRRHRPGPGEETPHAVHAAVHPDGDDH